MIIGEYTISEIFDGQKGEQGVSVSKVVTEWTKSTSPTQLPSNPTWSETKPSITSGEYLWYRDRTDLNNGTHSYSNPVCDITISGLVFDVDNINGQITNKIWQSDIATSINQYDNSTVSTLRDRVTTTETNISGVTTRVSDVETSVTNEANKRKAIYGTCSTNADTVAKVVTCQNFELYAGAEISVKFTNTNSTTNPTLNVNNTGAKPIKSFTGDNLSESEYSWEAEGVYNFVYDGSNWRLIDNGTVARITSAESSITQNANNINLKVSKDSVISEINQSSESITISADKVNIEGATIFSSGRLSQTSLNNAYDAKGSAATAKTEAINSANSATDTKLQSYSTTSQMNTAIGTAVNNAVDDIEANAIKSTVSCYYRSTSNTTPTITKTTSIGTSNNTDNAWEYVMPVPKRNTYFFTCEKYTYMDDSVAFSTVRPLDSQTYASKWVSSSDNTYVDGGRIYTHSITTSQLATDAIKSNNYQASQVTNSPYSVTGTFLDLSTGNIHTPNFGVNNDIGKAYLNGEIIATSGTIGNDSGNYWSIGNTTDSSGHVYASIVGNGTAYIQSNEFQLHNGASNYTNGSINTQWYTTINGGLSLTYPNYANVYYDYGMSSPVLDATSSRYYNSTVSENFLYIRKHNDTIPARPQDWNYIFSVNKDGYINASGLSINGTTIQDMITAGVDGGAYLPTSGGTISGNLTVTGTISGLKTLSINGKTYNGTSAVDVGVISTAYGGTGKSNAKDGLNHLINNLDTDSSTPVDADYYISQYVGGGSTTITYHRRPMSALWNYIKGKINADTTLYTDRFVAKTGGEFTGAITVSDSFTADEATVGNLIVNGAGRFTNGLYGDLTGNVTGTATKAAKVVDSNDGHDTTFAYSKAGLTSASWIAAWNGYELRAISPANLLTTIGAQPAGSYVSKTGDTMTGNLTVPTLQVDSIVNETYAHRVDFGRQNVNHMDFYEYGGLYNFYKSTTSTTGASTATLLGKITTNGWEGNVVGNVSGNATSATKATQDGDGNNISTTYLKLSGGTMTGQIKKAGAGGNWQSGRDRALIFMNSLSTYSTLASMKTDNGSWDIGAYSNSSFTDDLIFSYVKDTTYSGTNATDAQIRFLENGHIVASGFDGTATKANSLASNISIAVGNKTVSNINAGSTVSYALTDIAKDIGDSSAPDRGWMTKELYTTITNMAQNFDGGTITVSNVTASNGLSYNYNSTTGITSITGTYPVPTTAGTSGQVLIADSNGKGAWNNQSNLKIRRLDNKFTSRPTDANITSSADRAGSLELLLSTGTMTSHKPSNDGYILHMNWDNLNWDSQLYIPSENAHPQWRYMNNGTWGNWTTFLDSGNYNSYSPTLTGTGASGTWGINITGSAGSVSASNITGGYLNNHPESGNSSIVLPFIYNDLAHLLNRGFTCKATYFSTAPTNYTAITLSGGTDISSSLSIDRLFDTSPNYCGGVGNNSGTKTSNDIVVFDITMPTYTFGTIYYIDFGVTNWRAKNIAFYLMNSNNDSAYTLANSIMANAKSFYNFYYQAGGTGVNRLRVVVTDWNSATDHRIAQIGAINYSSNGARVGYMSTGIDDPVYRNITPANNSTYNLGSSSKKWNNIYADSFVGNASSATKATQDGSGNTITSTYVKKTGDIMTGILQMEAQLKTSFKSSVATGSYQATATTIETLCEELRYSSGVMGSVNITTAYTKDDITIPTRWYNFLWIPHRSGGVNGTASGDNCNYGSLYLSGMTSTGLYMIRYASSAIAEVKNLYNPPSATKATQDGDGNTISSSYLKLSGGTMTGAINLPYNKQSVSFRSDNASYDSGFIYGTNGNEALALVQQQDVTSFMVVHGSDPSTWTNTTWQSASPTIQTKNKSLYVNERINHGSTPSYNFKVNGTSYLGGNVRISNSNADTASCELQYNSTLDCLEFIFN